MACRSFREALSVGFNCPFDADSDGFPQANLLSCSCCVLETDGSYIYVYILPFLLRFAR